MIGNTKSEINSARRRAQARVETRSKYWKKRRWQNQLLETNSQSNSQRYRRRDRRIHRCKVVRIQTAPLREIAEDIPLMTTHFLTRHCALLKTELKQFKPAVMERLSSYSWPGNARQLENEIKRLVASVRGKTIAEEHLDLAVKELKQSVQKAQFFTKGRPSKRSHRSH